MTGFDSFDSEKINPAIETVKKLPNRIAGVQIIKPEIPTVCHKSLRIIDEVIARKNMPSMSQSMMVKAVTVAIETIVDTKEDIKMADTPQRSVCRYNILCRQMPQ